MNLIQLVGVIVFLFGILLLIALGLYHFLVAPHISLIVKIAFSAVIVGIIVVLLSLIKERISEKKQKN